MRQRCLIGFLLAIAAVLLAAPNGLVPWGERVHQAFIVHGWLALPALVSSLLVVAALLLPREGLGVPPRPQLVAFGVGVLMLIEPLTHLGLLGLIAWRAPSGSGDLILPRVGPGHHLGFSQLTVLSLAVPAAEEFFFRGRLVPFLLHRLGRGSAWSLSTLAFAAAHGDPNQALVALPLGMLLGWLRLSGSGVGVCILVHQAHNILFLAGGPTLIGEPWAGLILAIAGVLCIGLAWRWPGRAVGSFELAATSCLAALALISATYPTYQRVQERLWITAMHRAVAYGLLPDHIVLERIDKLCTRGMLDSRRRSALAQALGARPCRSFNRQVWVVGRIAPDRMSAMDEEDAYQRLHTLGCCPVSHVASHGDAARTLGLAHPLAFAQVSKWAPPEVLRWWMPLPEGNDQVLAQIEASTGMARTMLLESLELSYPARVADVLMKLPIDRITATDRAHLRAHCPDLDERLDELALSDPLRAQVFRQPDTAGER